MKDVHRLKADFDKKGKRKFTDGNKDLQDLWEEINRIPDTVCRLVTNDSKELVGLFLTKAKENSQFCW